MFLLVLDYSDHCSDISHGMFNMYILPSTNYDW